MKKQLNRTAEFIEKNKTAISVFSYGTLAAAVLFPKANQALINYRQLQANATINAVLTRELVDRVEDLTAVLSKGAKNVADAVENTP